MWEEYEDRLTAVLASEAATTEPGSAADSAALPAMRLRAIGLVGILRCLTSPEMRAAVAGQAPGERLAYVCDWLHAAGESA
jgi:hypothetical protein